jgi:hypothetical protein
VCSCEQDDKNNAADGINDGDNSWVSQEDMLSRRGLDVEKRKGNRK